MRRVLVVLALAACLGMAASGTAHAGGVMPDSDGGGSGGHSCGNPKHETVTGDRDEPLDINEDNVVWDGKGHKVPWIKVSGNCVTVKNWRIVDQNHPGIAVTGDNVTVRDNRKA